MAEQGSLRDSWDQEAENWVRWARKPGHDSYWRFHRDAFFGLVPPPGRLTLDIGCGEGRVARDLKARGHRVMALDASVSMVRAASEADPSIEALIADAADLPCENGIADLVISFMSLQDTDDMPGAIREAARVLETGGRYCVAIVHPLNSAGAFAGREHDAGFLLQDYMTVRRYSERVERDGMSLTFHQIHRPLHHYTQALSAAGFVIEAFHEVCVDDESVRVRGDRVRWQRIPLFVDLRALKT
jgi:SAM-dependent methyltransferase